MDVKPLSTAVITAELERRQAGSLVMMAEYQPKDYNWQCASGKGCAGGKLLPLLSCRNGELERLFDNAFLLSRLPTSAQNISPKAFVDKD